MTGDQRPGGPQPEGTDDDRVVPHPFAASPARTDTQPEPAAASATEPADLPGSEPLSDPGPGADAMAGDDAADERDEPEGPQEETPANEPQEEAPGEGAGAGAAPAATAPRRRRRDPLAAVLIGVLTLLLGFAFAVQVRSVGDDELLAGAREEDLVRILDEVNAREERLREQIADQRSALQQLSSSDSQSATALEEAHRRAEAIGILNGTVPARGPGLTMTIRDPEESVRVADVLDAIQELRGAGAETMQIDGVRVGVSTAVTGDPGGLMIDGRPITAPYEFVVIGHPQNMETALNIPGGVVQRITGRGGSATIVQSEEVVVDALRPLDTPQYAAPDTGD